MTTVTVEEAQNHLKDLIASISPGEKLVITQDGQPVAELTRPSQGFRPNEAEAEHAGRAPRRLGNCKGKLTILADDDDHLRDWTEYLP